MQSLRNLFVSDDEQRLRSGWRLIAQFALMLFLTFAFLTLFTVISQATPLLAFLGDPILISLASYTLSIYLARRWYDHRDLLSLGLHWNPAASRDLIAGIALPALLIGLIFLVEWALGWLTIEGFAWQSQGFSAWTELGYWAAAFIMVGFYEELLSRGYMLQNLAEGVGMSWAIFISSGIFALLHLANPGAGLASTLGVLSAGYFLAYGYVRSKQLWLPIGLHIGWNLFEGPIFGFPVSGLETAHLIQQSVTGPALITGGEFGPEAGLIVLPILGFGAWVINLYAKHYYAGKEKQ
jgi:membrane protease YdiL (CAAX protease family)